jgi:hypothetical protein
MPRKEIDYSKNIIYKIECNDLNITDCYVGHTTEFRKRKAAHKSDCNNIKSKNYNYNVYKFIRENGGWENWTMVMIQRYPCDDALEAGKRERYWFKRLNATLNTYIPSRSQKESSQEYYNDNKVEIKIKRKQYNHDHKEKINKKAIKYYNDHKEQLQQKNKCCCGGKYTTSHKSEHIKSIKHQQYVNNKIEAQYKHCVELFESTKHLKIH